MTVTHYPVAIKGVVVRDGAVLLLRYERDEWELPGGKIESGETPEGCVVREIRKETGWVVVAAEHRDVGLFRPEELAGIRLPDGYRRSIATWLGA